MIKPYPKLNFPPINIRAQRIGDGDDLSVWSSVRRCWLVLTPEEWVRRHVVEYLNREHGIPLVEMIEEYPVSLNGQPQRADLVVARGRTPLILVECKSPDVKITKDTFAQAVRYNSVVKARYVILTNGLTHMCFEHTGDGGYCSLSSFPEFCGG